jgi:hypothetical protein
MEIYKYLHPDRKDFFKSYRLRFTQPMALNDPYECLSAISETDYRKLLEKAVKSVENEDLISRIATNEVERQMILNELSSACESLEKQYKESNKVEEMFLESYLRNLNDRLVIFCLSKRNDSSLMWSHYTNGHKGFIIGFDSEHQFFKRQKDDPKDIGTLEEVRYSMDRYVVDIADLEFTSELFLIKNEEWEYEQEMRLARKQNQASEVIDNQAPKIFLFDIPKDAITSVIFGINSSDELKKEIKEILKSDEILRNIPHYQAYMDYKTFKIQTRKIS